MPNTIAPIVQRLEADIDQCLQLLCDRLEIECKDAATHRLLTIGGVGRTPECLRALAVYCVGQIAKAVQFNLEIKADLLGTNDNDVRDQLFRDVYSIIGQKSDDLTEEQKTDDRDPWLFEALSHLLVHLSKKSSAFLPVGNLIGLTMTHRAAKEPGLDLVAIYVGATIGVGIGESKAWKDDPSGGLESAAEKFSEVDLGRYDAELRATVGQMRYAMPPEYQAQITGALWKGERAYLPFIGYDGAHRPRWDARREGLASLQVPDTNKILVPLPLKDFRNFFDELANGMREYLTSLQGQ